MKIIYMKNNVITNKIEHILRYVNKNVEKRDFLANSADLIDRRET